MDSDEDNVDFVRPIVPPITSTPRIGHQNIPYNLPEQLPVSPVPDAAVTPPSPDDGVSAARGLSLVLPESQLSGSLQELCLLCADQLDDGKDTHSSKRFCKEISLIYRLKIYIHY